MYTELQSVLACLTCHHWTPTHSPVYQVTNTLSTSTCHTPPASPPLRSVSCPTWSGQCRPVGGLKTTSRQSHQAPGCPPSREACYRFIQQFCSPQECLGLAPTPPLLHSSFLLQWIAQLHHFIGVDCWAKLPTQLWPLFSHEAELSVLN